MGHTGILNLKIMRNYLKFGFAFILGIACTNSGFAQKRVTKTTKVSVVKSRPVLRNNVVYATPRKKIVTVRTLPKPYVVIKQNGNNFYYDNSKFYRLNGGRYVPGFPSVGLRINVLPVGFKTVIFNGRKFYTQNGIYFVKYQNDYEVIKPEIGTIVDELPSNTEKVIVDGITLYEYNDVLYEKIQVNGVRAYEVVGNIE